MPVYGKTHTHTYRALAVAAEWKKIDKCLIAINSVWVNTQYLIIYSRNSVNIYSTVVCHKWSQSIALTPSNHCHLKLDEWMAGWRAGGHKYAATIKWNVLKHNVDGLEWEREREKNHVNFLLSLQKCHPPSEPNQNCLQSWNCSHNRSLLRHSCTQMARKRNRYKESRVCVCGAV